MRFRRMVALLMVLAISFAPTASATQQATPLPNTAATSAPTQTPAVSVQSTASTQAATPTQTTAPAQSSDATVIPDVTPSPTLDPSIPTPVPPPAPLPVDTPSAVPTPTATPEATPTEEDSTTTEAPTNTPTATPTEEALTTTETPTAASTATPTAAPAVFDDTVRFTASLTCEGANEAATAVAVLQRKEGDKWEAIPDPEKPEQDYTIAFLADTQAEFVMTGLLADDEYRARLVSYDGTDADSLSVAYRDGEPKELQTEITVTLRQSEQPTNGPNETVAPSVEPSVEPSPSFDPNATPTPEPTTEPAVYGEDDFYAFTISLNTVTDDGTVTVSLLDADDKPLDTATLTIEESLSASASFSLAQKPIDGLYTARVTALGSLSVADAQAQGATLRYEDGELATAAYVEGLPALDMPMMLMASNMRAASGDDEWPLTLNTDITGEGKSSVEVTISLTSLPTDVNLLCDATSNTADITVKATTNIGAELTVTPIGVEGISYNVSVTQDGSCTVQVNLAADKFRVDGDDSQQTVLSSEGKTVSFSAMPLTTFDAKVNWNDNYAKNRPTPELTLYYQEGQNGDWTPLSDATPPSFTSTYNISTYTYTGLDKYSQDGTTPLIYGIQQNKLVDAYVNSVDTYLMDTMIAASVTNTLKTSISVTKVWYDNLNTGTTRPKYQDWLSKVNLIRRNTQTTETTTITGNPAFSQSQNADNNEWTLTVGDLPAYSSDGNPYEYYVTEETESVPDDKSQDHYKTVIENVNEYALKTDGAYDGGKFISTLTAEDEFTFTKKWIDGEDFDARPSVVFYLYRFAQDSGYTFETASPVQGMDTMTLGAKSEDNTYTYTYTVGSGETKLPRYDEQGRAYVYFLTERIGSNGRDYVSVVDNTYAVALSDSTKIDTNQEAAQRGYILNGGTVTNQSRATVSPSVTKTWNAKAAQGMQASVTMGLYRNLPNEDPQPVLDDSNTPVTLVMSGFTAERMTQTMSFPAQQKYDDDGYQYEYTIKEISATVNSNEATPTEGDFFADGDEFTAGNHSFRVNYGEDGSTVTNTLVGDTKLRVRKVWDEPLDGVTGTINIHLLQDGSLFTDYTNVTVEPTTENTTVTPAQAESGTLTVEGEGNFEVLFSGLPRYNASGAECNYTVVEDSATASNGTSYTYDGVVYNVENNVKTATLTNTSKPKGDTTLTFDITKVWLDDNDLLHRIPVHVQIYYIGDGGREPIGDPVVLTANGSWFARASITLTEAQAEDANRKLHKNYIAEEVSYGRENSDEPYMQVDNYATDNNVPTAAVKTKEHLYKATVEQSENGDQFTITNLRIGTLSISIQKEWVVGHLDGLTAQFQLVKNGADVEDNADPSLDGVKELAQTDGDTPITFDNLDKYDNVGALISYAVKERALKGESDQDWTEFVNGAVEWNENRIASQCTESTYEIGPEQHSGDKMTYKFTNACGERVKLYVNKVWRDDGTAAVMAARPDIVLDIARFSEVEGVMKKDEAFTLNERIWDTTRNSWFWRCSFGMVDRYDENGNEYEYRVTERIVQQSSSKYTATYYTETANADGTTTVHEPEGGAKQSTQDVFGEAAGNQNYTVAGFLGDEGDEGDENKKAGTIINTLSGSMIFKGTKIWKNLPSSFDKTQLPTVYVQLYCSTDGTTNRYEATDKVPDINGTPARAEIVGGSSIYTIPLGANDSTDPSLLLPLYTEYGHPYTYYVREEDADGNKLVLSGYEEGSVVGSVITNTYINAPPNNPAVIVTINKEWEGLPENSTKPDVKFTLYRKYANASQEEVATVTLSAGESDVEISTDKDGKELLYYAPNGSAYTYSVKETPILGYQIKYLDNNNTYQVVSQNVDVSLANTTDANSTYTGSVTFKNIYHGFIDSTNTNQLVATKEWQDGSNVHSTRPTIPDANNPDNSDISFNLFRGTENITENVDAEWSGKQGDSNTWLCTFTPKAESNYQLYTYDTQGRPYVYHVEEELYGKYKEHYTPTPSGMRVVNTLNSVSLYVDKQWYGSDGELNPQELTDLHALGAVDSLTFNVYRKPAIDETENGWELVPNVGTDGSVTIEWNDLLNAAKKGKHIPVATGLPKYTGDGQEYLYLYWVEEVVDPAPPTFTVDNPEKPTSVQTTFTITNTFITKKLYFVKDWEDDINREGVRPDELAITVTSTNSDNAATQSTTLKLTKDTTITDSDIADVLDSVTDGTRWVDEMTVLSSTNCSYSAKEAVPTGTDNITYTTTSEDGTAQITDTYTMFNFTNEHPSNSNQKTITIEATKVWNDGSNAYGDRPESVIFTLQRKLYGEGDNAWVDVPEYGTAGAIDCLPEGVSCSQRLSSQNGDWSNAKATWNGLFVNKEKETSTDPTQTYVYHVVETAADGSSLSSYRQSSPEVDATTVAVNAIKSITVENTPVTTELTVQKQWDDGTLTTYRKPIAVHLQRRLATSTNEGEWKDVEKAGSKVTLELSTDNPSQGTFADLPKYNSAQQEYAYRAVEKTPPEGYFAEHTTASSIKNTLQIIDVYVQKTWTDDYGQSLNAAQLTTINTLGGLPDITFQVQRKNGESWDDVQGATATYTAAQIIGKLTANPQDHEYVVAEGLPKYEPVTQTEYEYQVVETVSSPTDITLPSAASLQTATTTSQNAYTTKYTVPLTNQIAVRTLYFVKNWNDSVNSDGTRPDSLTIDVTRAVLGADGTSDNKTIPVTLSDPKATIAAATHGTVTDGSRWFGELTVPYSGTYSAAENNVPTLYTLSVSEHDQEPVPDSLGSYDWWSFTNTHARNVFGISVTKEWADDDKAVAFGDRPTSILVKLQRTTDPATEASWADLSALSPDVPTGFVAQKELTQDSTWTNGWQGLFAHQTKQSPTDSVKAYSYRVVEASVTGYSTSVVYNGGNAQYINGAETTTTATAALTNTLETVDLTVLITWTDPPSTTARPNGINVQLQRRPVGSSDTMWTNVTTTDRENAPVTSLVSKEKEWKDFTTFLGLPKATPTGHLYEYRVVQTDLPECYTEVTTFDRSQENLTAQTIHNSFSQGLEIDNRTNNPATSETDAGGFVGINTTSPTERNIAPYRTDERSVSWQPDENWQHKKGLQVKYREDSAADWVTVTIEDVADLSALSTRFPGVTLVSNGNIRTLTLAQDVSTMPYQTSVWVDFEPTLAVENTTTKNEGGEVEITVWSADGDGTGARYTAFTARGRAASTWMVDMNHIQISAPYGVTGDYSHNTTAATIKPDANGNFTTSVSVLIAGVMQTVQVRGQVTVLSRDRYSNPTEVSVTVSPMEFPLDVGIAFKAAAVPGNTPATGDPIDWVLMALLVSGLNLALASICSRRRKRLRR